MYASDMQYVCQIANRAVELSLGKIIAQLRYHLVETYVNKCNGQQLSNHVVFPGWGGQRTEN